MEGGRREGEGGAMEGKAGGLGVKGHPQLQNEFKDSLCYIRPFLQMKTKQNGGDGSADRAERAYSASMEN